jgi:hypothetical protein
MMRQGGESRIVLDWTGIVLILLYILMIPKYKNNDFKAILDLCWYMARPFIVFC